MASLEVPAGKWRNAGECQVADPHHQIGQRNQLPDSAHLAHVLFVGHRVDHRTGAEEQQRLEEGVGDQVEDRCLIGAHAGGDEHVAKLRAGGVGDHALDVVLRAADGGGEESRAGTDDGDHAECEGGELHQRRHARHQEHAGRHHGRGMDQRGDGGGAFHRIGQPDMQAELCRLAHRADEQQDADDLEGGEGAAEHGVGIGLVLRDGREDGGELDRAELEENQRDADGEEQVADAVDDEGLDRGGVGGGAVVPIADEQIGAEAHAFPAEEELHQVVGRHQHQHGEGEQREIGEEPVARVGVVRHVADRIDVDQHGDEGHHRHHDRGQRVVAQRPGGVEAAGLDPGAERDHAGCSSPETSWKQASGPQRGGQQHAQHGNRHGGAVADGAAEQAGDERAEKWCEDRDGVDHLIPSSGSRPRPRSSRGCGNRPPRWQGRSRLPRRRR